jgi:hypothetical protein
MKVCLQYNQLEAIISHNNKIFLGKLLIVLEDLPELTNSEYKKFTGGMKTLVTEEYAIYRDVYEKAIQAKNVSNFIVTSNFATKLNQRRDVLLDLNLSKRAEHTYFKSIKEDCFNNQVGEAVFSYLLTKISDEEAYNFYGQRDFPDTQKKLIARADSLSTVEKFIKFEYVLRNKSIIRISPSELLEQYKGYCLNLNQKSCGRNSFYSRLEDIGIMRSASNGYEHYNMPHDKLMEIANKEKWICKYDADICSNNDANEELIDIVALENVIEERNNEIENLKNIIEQQRKEIEELKLQNEEKIPNIEYEIVEEDEQEDAEEDDDDDDDDDDEEEEEEDEDEGDEKNIPEVDLFASF